jgi:hypothetical protein
MLALFWYCLSGLLLTEAHALIGLVSVSQRWLMCVQHPPRGKCDRYILRNIRSCLWLQRSALTCRSVPPHVENLAAMDKANPHPETKRTEILVCSSVFIIILCICVPLRFYARKFAGLGFWWDDWFCLAGFVSLRAFTL